jgi:hypothetical protein
MQLDSHRRQLSGCSFVASTSPLPLHHSQSASVPNTATMPYRFSLCPRRATIDSATETVEDNETNNVDALNTARQARRSSLYDLRRQTRFLIFFFALLETIWRGPVELVFAKNFVAEIDHGFVYTAGYVLSWIYMCFFGIVWAAFFEVRTITLNREATY